MAARLPDEVRVARLRESVRKASARRRVKLSADGKVQTLIWLPGNIRQQLDAMTNQNQQSLSAVTTALLESALSPSIPTPAPAPTPTVDALPLFDTAAAGAVDSADDRLARILALKREQPELSNYAIAGQVGCSEPTVRRALKKQTQEATG